MSGYDRQTPRTQSNPVSESYRTLAVEIGLEFDTGTESCPVISDCCSEKPIEHHVIDEMCCFTCDVSESETAIKHGTVETDSNCPCRPGMERLWGARRRNSDR